MYSRYLNTAVICIFLLYIHPTTSKKYTPDWASIDSRPIPNWYNDAKFGIFMHLTTSVVPGIWSEWSPLYWKHPNWYPESQSHYTEIDKFMKDNYGEKVTWQDIASMLKMEFFNASEIADIVHTSGAKYFVFTSKHLEGYPMWPSTYSFGYNSMDVGPKLDIVGELERAFRQKHPDLHFGLYYCLWEFDNPIWLNDLSNNKTTRRYVETKALPELYELVNKYNPDVLWADSGDALGTGNYIGSQNFLAWLYNESPVKDIVAINDRWGVETPGKHGGFFNGPDNYEPGELIPHKWERCTKFDKQLSWAYRKNYRLSDILDTQEIINILAETVSKNGNLLLNTPLNEEGKIIPIFEERLKNVGAWLKVNSEAIYGSRYWNYQGDSINNKKVWYTQSKNSRNVYAICLEWPNNGKTLTLGDVVSTSRTKITLLGYGNKSLKYRQSNGRLEIDFPSYYEFITTCEDGCEWGYVLKLVNIKPRHKTNVEVKLIQSNDNQEIGISDNECNDINCS